MRLPRSRRTLARLGASTVVGLIVAAVGGNAAPAFAKADTADLAYEVTGETVVKFAGKPFFVRVHNNGPATAVGAKVSIDATNLNLNKVEFALPTPVAGCTTDGQFKITCDLGDIPAGAYVSDYGIAIIASGGLAGNAGSFKVSLTSANDPNAANNAPQTIAVSVAGRAGFDLVAYAEDVYADNTGAPVQPGRQARFYWDLFNFGNLAASGLLLEIRLPQYVLFADHVPGCTYDAEDNQALCSLPDVLLAPGQGFIGLDPQGKPGTFVKVAPNAPGPVYLAGGFVAGVAVAAAEPGSSLRARRPAPTLNGFAVVTSTDGRTRKAAVDRDLSDNFAPFAVYAAGSADLSLTTTAVSGRVGETHDLTIAAHNGGPSKSVKNTLTIKAPTGTELTSTPAGCVPVTAGKQYTCAGDLESGSTVNNLFKLKILSATVTDGSAQIDGPLYDPQPANNKVTIKVTVLTNVDLPITGARAGLAGGVGVLLLMAGAILFVLARRRRVMLVTPNRDGAAA